MTAEERDRLTRLEGAVKHIKDDVRQLEDIKLSLSKIERHLFNDSDTGESGIVQVTKRNAIRLSNMEKRYAIAMGVISGVMLLIGRWVSKTLGL